MKSNKLIKILSVAFSLAGIVTVLGVGCGVGFQPFGEQADLGSKGNVSDAPQVISDDVPVTVVPGQNTASVINYEGALDTLVACTGQAPSANTLNRFRDRLAMFSETGSPTSVNSAMMHVQLTIGGETCNDLITAERGLASANRRIFNSVANFNGNTATELTPVVQADIVRRLARSCWQRNETAEELALITTGLQEFVTANNSNAGLGALYICSAVLGSASTTVF